MLIRPCQNVCIDPYKYILEWYIITTYIYIYIWELSFRPILDLAHGPPYMGTMLLSDPMMRRSSNGRPNSPHLYKKMDARERKGILTYGNCKDMGYNKRQRPEIPEIGARVGFILINCNN